MAKQGNMDKTLYVMRRWLAAILMVIFSSSALAAPGDLDVGFGGTGKVLVAGTSAYSVKVIQQLDGKIVVSSESALTRFNHDGTLDTTFSGDGVATASGGSVLLQQADGKLLTAGIWGPLRRYTADGVLDLTFPNSLYTIRGGVLQSDGKIVIAGQTINQSALTRFNPDGALDTTFDDDGVVTADMGGGGSESFSAVAQQTDGKLVVAGSISPGGSSNIWSAARFNSDGSLDSSFGKKNVYPVTGQNTALSVVQQANGGILVAGVANASEPDPTMGAIMRLKPLDGAIDTSFGAGGTVKISCMSVRDAIVQNDGKVVVTGWCGNDFQFRRFNDDGSVDTAIGGGTGIITTNLSVGTDSSLSVVQQHDRKLVLAGTVGTDKLGVARYLPDLDSDGDGIDDLTDNCPLDANTDQLDTDIDGLGDACDVDDDNDGIPDVSDAFPLDANESVDTDGDGTGNNADTDDDGDNVVDASDNC